MKPFRKILQALALSMTAVTAVTAMAQDKPTPPVFSKLSPESTAELAEFRRIAADLVSKREPGQQLTKTTKDFAVLQALADDPAMKQADQKAWIGMGVAFGDVLITYIPGLAWWDVRDEYGPGVVLRYKRTTMAIAAPVMLSKRVERGESFDLSFMADELKKYVKKNADKVQ